MDEHVEPNSPDQSAPPPVSYSRDQNPTWNIFGKFMALFSNRTTAIAGVLVLALGVIAGIIAVQRSTETRQHAAAIVSPQGPCYPVGDVNVNGKVDATDAQLVLKYVAGTAGTFNQKNADVDADGKITSADALKIQRYVVGLETTFPACRAPTQKPTLIPAPGSKLPPCYIPQPIIDKLRFSISTQNLNIQWNRPFGYGDVDLDGSVTSKDTDLVLKSDVGSYTLNPLQIEAADVDGAPNFLSGKSDVNVIDGQKILRYTGGLEKTFPVCGNLQPIPTCRPRPACLDANPPCYVIQTSDMCKPIPSPTKAPFPTPTPRPPMISPWSATPIPTR